MKLRLGRIGLSVSVKLLASVLELLIPYILEHIIDRVVPGGRVGPVVGWGALMVVVALLVRQTNIFANMTAVSVSRDCIERLRQDLFVRTARLSGSQTDAFTLPSLISRMTSDSYNVQNFITATQTIGIRAPILLVGGIALTLTMDPVLASILCVMAPVLLCVVVFISRKGVPLYDKVQQQMDAIVRVMRENITGIRVVKALSKTDYEKRRFRQTNDDLTRSDLKASIIMAIPGPSVQLCLNIGLVLVVILGAHRVNAGQSDPGVILAFLTYFTIILNSVMGLNRIFMLLSKASASADRIGRVLETGDDQPVEPLTEARRSSSGAFLEFDHVSFTHLSTAPEAEAASFAGGQRAKCLDDVSFTLDRGETLGIIGATGSGKSTIINLLMRFYDAQAGDCRVDGHDMYALTRSSLRRAYAMVLQDTWLFRGTVYENIAYGKENATREEVVSAAKAARIHGYIMQLPQGYDTVISEDGGNISKGQKQLMTIARAMLYDAKMLILDEATSNVDTTTERRIQKAMRELMADKTCFVIAHRLSTIVDADVILVLNDGRIVEQGTHRELLERRGFYHQLYTSQYAV